MPETITKPPKAKPGSIDWPMVINLYKQGLDAHDISRETGINRQTINVGLCKRGVTKEPRNLKYEGDSASLSRVTRAKLAAEVERTLGKVANCDPRKPEALNLHADTLQKVAKTASLVHGCGETSAIALVVTGVITDKPEREAIDVQSEVDPEV